MSKHEAEIQHAIIDAVQYFFTSSEFGIGIPREDIRVLCPPSGGQARTINDFGRKPYDVGIYALDTIVIFLEIKERGKSGAISGFNVSQQGMLKGLANNGVDIPYAYNGWDFTWAQRLSASQVLQQAHVRKAHQMCNPVLTNPLAPAQILADYLSAATSSSSRRLAEILESDIHQLDNLNSMPLMIMANLDPKNAKVLVDRPPKEALKLMKNLFNLPQSGRNKLIAKLLSSPSGPSVALMAQAIFDMRDNWDNSSKMTHQPRHPRP